MAVRHLFRDFLEDATQYRRAEQFWEDLVTQAVHARGLDLDLEPWRPDRFNDGTPMPKDGSPIYHARCERLRRGVQIIQDPPESDEIEVTAWFDEFDFSDAGGPGYTVELTIGLSLSQESAEVARHLVGMWLDPANTMEDVKRSMQVVLPQGRKHQP